MSTFAYRDERVVEARDEVWVSTAKLARVTTGMAPREYDSVVAEDTLILGLAGDNGQAEHWLEDVHGVVKSSVRGNLGVTPRGTRLRGYAVPASPCEFLFVHLHPSAIDECRAELRLPVGELRPRIPYESARVTATLEKMAVELRDPGAGGAALLEALVTVLTLELARECVGGAPLRGVPKLAKSQVARVRDYVEANLGRDVSLAELAGVVGLSRWHFSRAFKAASGLSPHRFVEARRIERACELLANRSLTVGAIARAVGFGGASQFARAFRRRRGMSPLKYRAGC